MNDNLAVDEGTTVAEEPFEAEIPISVKLVLTAMFGGLVGMVLMLPVLVGIPLAFGLFRTEPIAQFAPFLAQVGVEPSLALGVSLFVVGGATILPLMFVVVGSFLPPKEPRYLRGVTFATAFWTGFVLAFWPGGGLLTGAVFLLVSLVAHWIYGAALGRVLDGLMEIPQHEV